MDDLIASPKSSMASLRLQEVLSSPVRKDFPAMALPLDVRDPVRGTEDMDWAKRVFYLSTEKVFPGFTQLAQHRKIAHSLYTMRTRSSLLLGVLLTASFYFDIPWTIGWACFIEFRVPTLKKVHGGLLFGSSVGFIIINYIRLITGMNGNCEDDPQRLGVYWMLTALVQMPIIIFFLLTDFFSPVFFPVTTVMNSIQAVLLILELMAGFFHLNSIISDELQVLRLGHETWKLSARKHLKPH